jgi:hypothetical protein
VDTSEGPADVAAVRAAQLERWRDAGLLDPDQVERIQAFEATRPDGDPTRSPIPAAAGAATSGVTPRGASAGTAGTRPAPRRTVIAEAVGYVGAALALGALALLLGELWATLTDGGRLTLASLVAVVLGGAAAALRAARAPAVARLASVLAAAAVAAVAWAAGTLTADVLGWNGADVALAVSATATAAALPAYLSRPRPLPQLVLLTAVVATAQTASLRAGELPNDALWYGVPLVAVGAVWVLLGVGGWLVPRAVASTAGGLLALAGIQVAAFGDHRAGVLSVGVAVATAAVGVAIVAGGTHHLAVGAVGLFVLLPQLVVEVFGDAIGAPATLLVVGASLVLVAVGLGRVRRDGGPDAPAPGGPS